MTIIYSLKSQDHRDVSKGQCSSFFSVLLPDFLPSSPSIPPTRPLLRPPLFPHPSRCPSPSLLVLLLLLLWLMVLLLLLLLQLMVLLVLSYENKTVLLQARSPF